MCKTFAYLFIAVCLTTAPAFADGVMRPVDKNYPKDFLRTRMTKVDVAIHGQIAVTKVYQEFVNEWRQKTNAVYSFPLPPDARATDFFFWANDTMYQAVLKVKEQATNPGTGEGGIDALLNAYLGANALRVLINDVPPGIVQKTQLEYITLCSYEQGRVRYTFPLNTADFVSSPLESFTLTVRIEAGVDILSSAVDEYTDVRTAVADARHRVLTLEKSKLYPTKDLTVSYTTMSDSLNADFYSVDNDSLDGHFLLFLTPPTSHDTAASLPKSIVFLLDRSASANGAPLTAAKAAAQECLGRLRPADRFNIIAMNTGALTFKPASVPATADNIASGKAFLAGIAASGGSNLSGGLTSALGMFGSDSLSKAVMLFSDGLSVVDPKAVLAMNTRQAGIFPIGIGPAVNRARLEMIAYMNYGFPTFLALTDPLTSGIVTVFNKINDPVLKNTKMEFGSNVYDILPQTLQTVYSGSRFFVTGRYKNPGTSTMSIAGYAVAGPRFFDFRLPFTPDTSTNRFAEKFWGKEKIDAIERQIAVYGAVDSLKQLAIKYSLLYNIRCQYTAYVADKTKPMTSAGEYCAIEAFSIALDGAAVTLRWTLRGADDVVECIVYRRDGDASGFVRIGTASNRERAFTDKRTSLHPAAYRLELVTRSGKRIFSATISTEDTMTPAAFALERNYPNPFNPSTSVRFSVATAQMVRLTIYDMLGREAAVLVNERLQPGVYARTWDARSLPSGVYVSVMRAGAFTASQKMILQK